MKFQAPCLACGTLTREGTYCLKHKPAPRQRYDAGGYDRPWRALRLEILERDGWRCMRCGKALMGADATVDHIVPIRVAPDLRLEPSNCRAVCRACNSAIAAAGREAAKRQR